MDTTNAPIPEPTSLPDQLLNAKEEELMNQPVPVEVVTPAMTDLPLTPSGKLLMNFLNQIGVGSDLVEAFDAFMLRRLKIVLEQKTLVFPKKNEFDQFQNIATFENIKINPPRYIREGKVLPMTPQLAREQGVTYGADIYVDVIVRNNGVEIERRQNVCIGMIPIMIRSQFCNLHGKTPEQLMLYGEDPYDPYGIFVVDGTEKIIQMHEQLTLNKIYMMNTDDKFNVIVRIMANTSRGTTPTELCLDRKHHRFIRIRLPSMRSISDKKGKSMNVLRIFRLFGISDIEQILDIIKWFLKPEHVEKAMLKLAGNIIDFQQVTNDEDIVMDKMGKKSATKDERSAEIVRIMSTDLFPHLNNMPGPDNETKNEMDSRIGGLKLQMLGILTARMLEFLAGYRKVDDRDSWSNKRVESAGRLMEQLLRSVWSKTLGQISASIATGLVKDVNGIVEKLRSSLITQTFRDSMISSNWGVKGHPMKNNIAQTPDRASRIAIAAHVTTIDVPLSRTTRNQTLRMVQNSQYGFVCPVSTPEGENAGLLKNRSLTARVTIEHSDVELIRMLWGDNGMIQYVFSDTQYRNNYPDKCVVNGKFIGWCSADETYKFLLHQRRHGYIPFDFSIIKEDDWIYVDISPSRLIRPLLIVNENQELMIDVLNLREADIHTLITSGAMEYVSAWEQEYIKVAPETDDILRRKQLFDEAVQTLMAAQASLAALDELNALAETSNDAERNDKLKAVTEAEEALNSLKKTNAPYTHCEIDPLAILGYPASVIPYPNHNQAPRNTFQVSMGKQALGIYNMMYHIRMGDGKIKILANGTKPLVETETYAMTGLDTFGSGENIMGAFGNFPGNEEDSFIVKKGALERGKFRYTKYYSVVTQVKKTNEMEERLAKPEIRNGEPVNRYQYIQSFERNDPRNGLPMIGAPLRQGDCVIGKIQHISTPGQQQPPHNESVLMRVGDEGIVDKVWVTSDGKSTYVTVKLRVTRTPEAGDKFAPRNAQKGTIGIVVDDIDMPVNAEGIRPDFIMNSTCFTADTQISLRNGTARKLTSMAYEGGDRVVSWDKEKFGFKQAYSAGYESKGVKEIVKLTLSDGRTIRCTPSHKFPVIIKSDILNIQDCVPASEITNDMYLIAGLEGVLDTRDELEKTWTLTTTNYTFTMDNEIARERSLAYMRVLGYMLADGSLFRCRRDDRVCSSIVMGCELDAESMLDDLDLLIDYRLKKSYVVSEKGDVISLRLTAKLAQSFASLEDITIGRRSLDVGFWPKFLFDEKCPKSIIREFLGGLFGGDGWAPYLMTNKQDGQGTVTFNPVAFSQSATLDLTDCIFDKLVDLSHLLARVGVPDCRVDNPKKYVLPNGKEMVTCVLQTPRGVDFGDKVGFRHCVQKMYRMAAYQSYMRYLNNVKRQNDFVISRAIQIYDNKEVGHSLMAALEKARAELFANEKPFNDYYSNGTLDQVRNRRRADRFKELKKWEYDRIEDAEQYLRRIGAYHWFRHEDGTGGVDYIIKKADIHTPYFLLKLHDRRSVGSEEVFDLGVMETHTLTVFGIAANNCMPSRMTISYLLELLFGWHASLRCVTVNGTAFRKPDISLARDTLTEYGYDQFGYSVMRSGLSGNLMSVMINMGPLYMQALKHHAVDKIQGRGRGTVKPMTRQPPKGRGNKGGLRFGEMERDAAVSHGASAFTRERLMKTSDGYETVFCKNCGIFAVTNATDGKYLPCKLCNQSDFGRYMIPYSYKLLIHLLGAMGINLRPEFMTQEEYRQKLFSMSTQAISADEIIQTNQEIAEVEDEAEAEAEAEIESDQIVGYDEEGQEVVTQVNDYYG